MIYLFVFLAVFALASLVCIGAGTRQYLSGPDKFPFRDAVRFSAEDYAYGFMGVVRGIRDFIVIAASLLFTFGFFLVFVPVPYAAGMTVGFIGRLLIGAWSVAKDGYAKGSAWLTGSIEAGIRPASRWANSL